MKIFLVCAGGMSTSLLVERMKEEAVHRNLECEIQAIPIMSLTRSVQNASCVLVAPQVRHQFKSIQEMAEKSGKPVGLIDPTAYGRLDAQAVLNQAVQLAQ